jgi:hypothetical protein
LNRLENQDCFISLEGPASRGDGGAENVEFVWRYGDPVGDNN